MSMTERLTEFNAAYGGYRTRQHVFNEEAIQKLADYEDIGTVSEFRELKEKATAKKPIPYENTGIIECPHCYTNISDLKTKWCCICGQHLDWSEGKE